MSRYAWSQSAGAGSVRARNLLSGGPGGIAPAIGLVRARRLALRLTGFRLTPQIDGARPRQGMAS